MGAGVGRGGVRTPAFDLGLVAYLSGVRPGETVELLSRRDTSSIMSVLESLAGDLGAPDLVASLGTSAIKALVDLAITAYTRAPRTRPHRPARPPPRALPRHRRRRSSPDVVVDLAWLLTEEIDAMPAAWRPALAIFVP